MFAIFQVFIIICNIKIVSNLIFLFMYFFLYLCIIFICVCEPNVGTFFNIVKCKFCFTVLAQKERSKTNLQCYLNCKHLEMIKLTSIYLARISFLSFREAWVKVSFQNPFIHFKPKVSINKIVKCPVISVYIKILQFLLTLSSVFINPQTIFFWKETSVSTTKLFYFVEDFSICGSHFSSTNHSLSWFKLIN